MLARLLAALMLPWPALAGGQSYPTEKQLRVQAQAYLSALCSQNPRACNDAGEAFAGYEANLPKTQACEIGPCSQDTIDGLNLVLDELDRQVAALPAPSGIGPGALLRLSALARARLGAAAAHLKDHPSSRSRLWSGDFAEVQ